MKLECPVCGFELWICRPEQNNDSQNPNRLFQLWCAWEYCDWGHHREGRDGLAEGQTLEAAFENLKRMIREEGFKTE